MSRAVLPLALILSSDAMLVFKPRIIASIVVFIYMSHISCHLERYHSYPDWPNRGPEPVTRAADTLRLSPADLPVTLM